MKLSDRDVDNLLEYIKGVARLLYDYGLLDHEGLQASAEAYARIEVLWKECKEAQQTNEVLATQRDHWRILYEAAKVELLGLQVEMDDDTVRSQGGN